MTLKHCIICWLTSTFIGDSRQRWHWQDLFCLACWCLVWCYSHIRGILQLLCQSWVCLPSYLPVRLDSQKSHEFILFPLRMNKINFDQHSTQQWTHNASLTFLLAFFCDCKYVTNFSGLWTTKHQFASVFFPKKIRSECILKLNAQLKAEPWFIWLSVYFFLWLGKYQQLFRPPGQQNIITQICYRWQMCKFITKGNIRNKMHALKQISTAAFQWEPSKNISLIYTGRTAVLSPCYKYNLLKNSTLLLVTVN